MRKDVLVRPCYVLLNRSPFRNFPYKVWILYYYANVLATQTPLCLDRVSHCRAIIYTSLQVRLEKPLIIYSLRLCWTSYGEVTPLTMMITASCRKKAGSTSCTPSCEHTRHRMRQFFREFTFAFLEHPAAAE